MASWLPGFVEGVFIEVLWDIETLKVEGRRDGERVLDSVWWKGEVVEVKTDRGRTTAKILYDALGEFEEQVGEVSVFPFHMQIADGSEVTQLRWRYYESSGDVSYRILHADRDADHGVLRSTSTAADGQCQNFLDLEQHVETLSCRMDDMEKYVQSQGAMSSRLSAVSKADQSCEAIFNLLRHRVAGVVQKPLPSYRQRGGTEEASSAFDWSCVGTLRAEADCTVAQFEMACCHVKQVSGTSYFTADGRPFTPHSGCLNASTGVAEMLFSSLSELCRALAISHDKDAITIAKRVRHAAKKTRVDDAAVRIAGTFVVDPDAESTPAAILICRGMHEGLLYNEQVEALTREDRELDPRSVWYRQPLRKQKMDVLSLLKYVYPNANASTPSYKDLLTTTRKFTSCLALRWQSVPNPNPKMWSRTMVLRPDFAGKLEVDIPYILFRGTRGFNEVTDLVNDDFLKRQLS